MNSISAIAFPISLHCSRCCHTLAHIPVHNALCMRDLCFVRVNVVLVVTAQNRIRNGQIDPHPMRICGFATQPPPPYIIQLSPLLFHTNPIFISHDFLNTPVISLQAILDRLFCLTYLDIPGDNRRQIVEQAGLEPANIVMDRATANLSEHDDVLLAYHASMRLHSATVLTAKINGVLSILLCFPHVRITLNLY